MKDLFFSEWRRFRRHALIAAICHGLALLFLSRITNVLQLPDDDQGMMLAIYMLLGLALALVQVGGYRKPNQWLWLIHRPLPPTRIFAALTLSALAMLSLAVFLPLLLFVLATDLFSTHVVDTRHYVALFHVLAFSMMAWFAGTLASLSRNKVTVAALVVPFLLAMHLASVWSLLLPVLVCLAWLSWIAMQSFRADRSAPIARSSVLLLTALPLQLVFFLLVFHLSKAAVSVVQLMEHNNYPTETVLTTDKNADERLRSFSQSGFIRGLEGSQDPRAAEWREQIPLLEVADLAPDVLQFPVRNQISNLRGRWWDAKRGIEWTFSHDRMMFHGRDLKTGDDRGWWSTTGAGDQHPFSQIPLFGMSSDALFAIDDETQRQHELFHLPHGERFVGLPVRALDRTLVLTNQRVLAYRKDRQTASKFAPLQLDWQLALAVGDGEVPTVSIVELLDGWLVSIFYFAPKELDGFESLAEQWQQVVHVDESGTATVVGEVRNIRNVSVSIGSAPLVPKASWWLSPMLYMFARWPESTLDKGLTQPPQLAPLPVVPMFYPVAAALMLLSFVLGYWWLRGSQINTARRRLWLVSCALLGLPAFFSLVCLEPRTKRV
ncbi:MAG: hypothetical protein ACKVRP_14015 [Bacteroidota bacterium]